MNKETSYRKGIILTTLNLKGKESEGTKTKKDVGFDNVPVAPAPTTNKNSSHHFGKERDSSLWSDKEGQQPPWLDP